MANGELGVQSKCRLEKCESFSLLSVEVLYCANILCVDLRGECPIGSLKQTQYCSVLIKALRRYQNS